MNVGLVGITGYAGMELARLLSGHPSMKLTMACSREESGKELGKYYPFLQKLPGSDLQISVYSPDVAAERCDLVFLAVPAGTALKMTPELLEKGVRVVDFSADFRIKDTAVYEEWYGLPHTASTLLEEAVYGIPELNAQAIKKARLIANPGCYPTSVILGLYPAITKNLIQTEGIIIDSKSGTTGAGRKPKLPNLFSEVADTFRAYGLVRHRHTPEIEQELSLFAKKDVQVQFTPHLVPMNRGILSTIYASLANPSLKLEDVHAAYTEVWNDAPWVRILPLGQLPETRYVRGTMFCDIGLAVDSRTKRLIVVSVIDNLCRGAAGQALANANLMSGLPVDEGLRLQAPVF
ncbi:MAG: N-acetyl-gamma-glutamyl-phosphate reductase [Desulfovibrionaceae bacterium]|nr:N-acetyl-gamma-glutamyl-phosphate reductase [Desulfovibrionaceae bacterium]